MHAALRRGLRGQGSFLSARDPWAHQHQQRLTLCPKESFPSERCFVLRSLTRNKKDCESVAEIPDTCSI